MATYLEGYEGVRVLGARLVILLEKEEDTTSSGIVLVQDHKEPKFEGLVVAAGDGARNHNGDRIPMDVAVGDRVIYSRMAGVPINYGGNDLLVINERDVIAVIEQ